MSAGAIPDAYYLELEPGLDENSVHQVRARRRAARGRQDCPARRGTSGLGQEPAAEK